MRGFCCLLLMFCVVSTHAKEEREREVKKGKKVMYDRKGDIGVTVRWNKWRNPNQRTLCCPLAHKHCKYPCKGLSCEAQCTLSCGLFSLFQCPPISCAKANPFQCVSADACPAGWTVSGSKCYRLFSCSSPPESCDWGSALRKCMEQGGTLAIIESDAENMVVQGLTSGLSNSEAPFIGLQDWTQENTFSWGNGMALGSYNNWLGGQPDNGAGAAAGAQGNQHCAVMRPTDGTWNDLVCTGPRAYVCQRPG